MRNAEVPYDMHLYGGVGHSFTHPHSSLMGIPGIAYDERAAKHSWNAMRTLLAEVL
jgi:dienelactone hydrolase